MYVYIFDYFSINWSDTSLLVSRYSLILILHYCGSVVECLGRDRDVAGSGLTRVTALCLEHDTLIPA